MADLTHLNADGGAHMVDVSAKADTAREAVAEGQHDIGCRQLRHFRRAAATAGQCQ